MKDARIILPEAVTKRLGLDTQASVELHLSDRLTAKEDITAGSTLAEAGERGILVGDIPPLTARYFEINQL